jgi:two-component system sensor histidine kinase MtrB
VSSSGRRGGGRRRGLRATITLTFALGGLALAGVMSLGTFSVAREYLVTQRERVAQQQAFIDAAVVRDGMLTRTRPVSEVISAAAPSSDTRIFVQRGGQWFGAGLTEPTEVIPDDLRAAVAAGTPAMQWGGTADGPFIATAVPLPAVDATFFEVSATPELQRTLTALAVVLGVFAVLTATAGAVVGRWAAGRVVAPLDDIAGTAAQVAGGDLTQRLPATDDPDLVTLVASFNAMVDGLTERIERDARFTADVSHELRSPLTTLTTSVQLLERRRDELPERTREVVDLVVAEVVRFRQVVEDLLELARLDALDGKALRARQQVDVVDLLRETMAMSGRPGGISGAGSVPLPVRADKEQLARAVVNLLENADRHGGGLVAVRAQRDGDDAVVHVDDAGPGVPEADRLRIFERFVRAGSRGSLPGTGLGLSLVAETVRAHGGGVHVEDVPGGGARFVVRLPLDGSPS